MKTVVITDLSYKEFDSSYEAIQVTSREYDKARSVSWDDAKDMSYTVHTITPTTYVIPGYGKMLVGYTTTLEAALTAIFEVKERDMQEQLEKQYRDEIDILSHKNLMMTLQLVSLKPKGKLRKVINKILDKWGIR